MVMYIKNFLLFLILLFIITGCSSKFSGDSYSSQDDGYIFQSASLENTIQQRDLRFQKYRKLTKLKKNLGSLDSYSNYQNNRMDLDIELFDF